MASEAPPTPPAPVAKKRVDVVVDGFNLWHGIKELGRPELKWLDLMKLGRHLIDGGTEEIGDVIYFSALASWTRGSKRHETYLKALGATGVGVRLGRFQPKTSRCRHCGKSNTGHEEKESDVNLAVNMTLGLIMSQIAPGSQASCDRVVLVSADSDFASTVRALRKVLEKHDRSPIRLAFPPGRKSHELRQAVGRKPVLLGERHFEPCMLPDRVPLEKGFAERPAEWTSGYLKPKRP